MSDELECQHHSICGGYAETERERENVLCEHCLESEDREALERQAYLDNLAELERVTAERDLLREYWLAVGAFNDVLGAASDDPATAAEIERNAEERLDNAETAVQAFYRKVDIYADTAAQIRAQTGSNPQCRCVSVPVELAATYQDTGLPRVDSEVRRLHSLLNRVRLHVPQLQGMPGLLGDIEAALAPQGEGERT